MLEFLKSFGLGLCIFGPLVAILIGSIFILGARGFIITVLILGIIGYTILMCWIIGDTIRIYKK